MHSEARAVGFRFFDVILVGTMVGALATFAAYGVRRYTQITKTAQAPNAVGDVTIAAAATLAASMPARSPEGSAFDPRAVRAALTSGIGSGFETLDPDHVRARAPVETKRGARRTASVALPVRATGDIWLEDDVSHVAVRARLQGASDVAIAAADGVALYARAYQGSDVVHRVHAEGTEDFVLFDRKPDRESVVYDVDVSRVAGLRLVSGTLEFLDASGTPTLRIAPPYVSSADGARREARILVSGCAYDENTRGPWGRPITEPGSTSCEVRVAWGGESIKYPAVLDPSWTATGSMALPRVYHTATMLSSGKVLVAGGCSGGVNCSSSLIANAELYDPTSRTFATTGSMTVARFGHSATLLPSGKVLVAGGSNTNGYSSNAAEMFDGVSSFTATGTMTTPRINHTATLLGSGKVLMAGGSGNSSAELFDGVSNFTATGNMTVARYHHAATLLSSGKVLIAGGVFNNSSAELFDGVSSFTATGNMTMPRSYHTATLLNSGKVLVAGGDDGSGSPSRSSASAELFDGVSSFTATGNMTMPRQYHTATLLPSGKVLVAGGQNGNGYLSSAELFDGTSSFTATVFMATPRADHTATTIGLGEILAPGGSSFAVFSTAEVFRAFPAGTACSADGDCESNFCNENCCTASCTGACKTCDTTGACKTVTNAPDPDTCTGTKTCDATGACKLIVGQPCPNGNSDCASGVCVAGSCASATCTSDTECGTNGFCATSGTCAGQLGSGQACNLAADCKSPGCHECKSGFCVDGVCCDGACSGQCEACDVAATKGTCSAVQGAQHGARPVCGGTAKDCAGACDGVHRDLCAYPAPNTPCVVSCAGSSKTIGACNGQGACSSASTTTQPCPGNLVCADASGCKTSCTIDADCTAGFGCSQGICVPKAGAKCQGDHHSLAQDGTVKDCTPYLCGTSGECSTSCGSVSDCASPSVCDPSGHCVTAPSNSGGSGGCAVAPARGDNARGALGAWLAFALLARRRRRVRA